MLLLIELITKKLIMWLLMGFGLIWLSILEPSGWLYLPDLSTISLALTSTSTEKQSFPFSHADVKAMTTPHFIIRYSIADKGSAEFILREAEPAYTKVVNYLGKDPNAEIQIFLAPDNNTFELLQPPKQVGPSWAIGLAYPQENLILMKSPRLLPNSILVLKETLIHELTHILIGKVLGPKNTMPRWLNEGLAMYIAGQWGTQETIELTRISLLNSFIPMSELSYSFPVDAKPALQAYIQSFSFVSYLEKNYGVTSLHQLIQSFTETQNREIAFELTFGVPLSKLEKDWRSFVRIRYTWMPTLISGTTVWFLVAWLVIGSYLTKRRKNKSKLLLWEAEEAQEVWHDNYTEGLK